MIDDIIIDMAEGGTSLDRLMECLTVEWGYTKEEVEDTIMFLETIGKVKGWFDGDKPMIGAVE